MPEAARMFDEGLEAFRAARQRTTDLIRPLGQEELDRVPAPGRWSVGEVVDHLILATEFYQEQLEELIRLKRNGQRPLLRRTFSDFDVEIRFVPKGLLRRMEVPISFFTGFLPWSVRQVILRNRLIPLRTPPQTMPHHGLPGEELRSRLLVSFESFKSVYESNADLDYRELKLRHPLPGYISMLDLTSFLSGHEFRHQKQIVKALRGRK